MQLNKKKALAARALAVGKNRVVFNIHRLEEVKDAITKQDIHDLVKSGAIMVREVTGRRKIQARGRRRIGSIRMKVKNRKAKYIILTRKLRGYVKELKKHGTLSKEEFTNIRKEIRAKNFRSKSHMKERLELLDKQKKEKKEKKK